MPKKPTKAYSIGSQKDLDAFSDSFTRTSGKKAEKKVVANATNLSSLNLQQLDGLDEKIYLSQTKVDLNLEGDVGVYNAALLSPRFTRRGFKNRNISFLIPSSLDAASKALLEERICSFAKAESASKVKNLLSTGAVISMDEAQKLGLIDTVIDLSKKRGSNAGKSAVVSSEGNPAPENTADGK